jgi:putative Mn2+ efflux pump MntP
LDYFELLVIAVGLSMDAFAVSLCQGLNMWKFSFPRALLAAGFFGVFQAFMPLVGFSLGVQFEQYITSYDHWLAFILLFLIGGKMLREAFTQVDDCFAFDNGIDIKELFILAIATSIDALAIGITFAFLQVAIIPSVLIIGLTTFTLSLVGVGIGNLFGARFKSKAEIAGGLVLMGIGLKILLEHLQIIKF